MLLKNATVNDSGEYSVTAVNDCGIGTGYLQVQVHISKISIPAISFVLI